jgi:class 3 adenylate cyclase
MLDMRQSTDHLRQAIRAKVSEMQRVFYEVSALLPPMAKVINDHEGAVTEYLGDGLLALFQLPRNEEEQAPILRRIINGAKQCMETLEEVINPILFSRYYLPRLNIGIGLAFSDAIISHFGLPPDTQVKVLGECIYFASECSKEWNEIVLHENLQRIWPTSKDGKLTFRFKSFKKDVNGYIVNR